MIHRWAFDQAFDHHRGSLGAVLRHDRLAREVVTSAELVNLVMLWRAASDGTSARLCSDGDGVDRNHRADSHSHLRNLPAARLDRASRPWFEVVIVVK